MFRDLTAVCCFLVAVVAQGCVASDPQITPGPGSAFEPAPFNESIDRATLEADLRSMAHDSTRGRLVGTLENRKAADWVRARFDSLGLEPAGDDGSYDQRFDMMWFSLSAPNELEIGGEADARMPGEGWYPLNFSASTSVTGEVVMAGFGIQEPRLSYDDYRGADVTGKIVLVFDREPRVGDPSSPFDGLVTTAASREWRKALAAQRQGAVGILFVRDVHNREDIEDWGRAAASYWPGEPRRIEWFRLRSWIEGIEIPGAAISTEVAESLVAGSGRTLREWAIAAETASGGLGVSALPNANVTLTTTVDRHLTPGRNVLAMVRGSDPELKDEAVIVVAHHDMNGVEDGIIYSGADDNASGSAGLLAIAEAYALAAEAGERPRRSVVFVSSDAEERGPSLGAWHLTAHPPFPLANIAAVLNADMIGRNEEVPEDGGGRFSGLEPQSAEANVNSVNVIGSSRSPELAEAIRSANVLADLTLRFRYDNNESNLLRRSDQWPFIQNGVPALFFNTGLHPDYHTGEDRPEHINFEKMTRIVRLLHQASWDLANADGRPALEGMRPRPRS